MKDYSHMPCALCGRTGKAQQALAEALDTIEQLKARIEELEEINGGVE